MSTGDRLNALYDLNRNWSGQFNTNQLEWFSVKLIKFEIDDLRDGVAYIIDNYDGYPPKLADLRRACGAAMRRRLGSTSGNRSRNLQPGDTVNGERTFTPAQANVELERIRRECPETFLPAPPEPIRMDNLSPEDSRKRFELYMNRIYVSGLRKAIRLDPSLTTPEEQQDLF